MPPIGEHVTGQDTMLHKLLVEFGPKKGGIFDLEAAAKKRDEVTQAYESKTMNFYKGYGEGTRYRTKEDPLSSRVTTINVPQHAVETTAQSLLVSYAKMTKEQQELVFPRILTAANRDSVVKIACVSEAQAHALNSIILRNATDWTVRVPSDSRGGLNFNVSGSGRVATSCDCENFTLGGNTNCKHMRYVTGNPRFYGVPNS